MEDFSTFRHRFRYLMQQKKVSPAEASRGMGVTEAMVSRWMSGDSQNPQKKSLYKISDYFGCNVAWLLTGDGPKYKERDRDLASGSGCNQSEDDISETEAIAMMLNVIRSKTIHRVALLSNIRAFNQAVEKEKENAEMKDEMKELREQVGRIEKMLLAMSPSLESEKNGQATIIEMESWKLNRMNQVNS